MWELTFKKLEVQYFFKCCVFVYMCNVLHISLHFHISLEDERCAHKLYKKFGQRHPCGKEYKHFITLLQFSRNTSYPLQIAWARQL